jgi:predicted PurR-regulated permease PerM
LPDSITATRAFAAIQLASLAGRRRERAHGSIVVVPARMRPVFQPSAEDWPYLRRLGWTILAAAAIVIVWRASNILLLAFGSVLGAVVLRSAARMVQRLGLKNHKAALTLGTLVVLAVVGVIGYLLVVQFGSEISGMIANLPGTIATVERGLATTSAGRAVVEATHAAVGGPAIAKRLGEMMLGGGAILVNLVIVIVGAMFIAANPRPYVRAVVLLTPPPGRKAMEHALGEISAALRLWLKAKLIAMVIMTLVISGALWLAGLKSWAALGLLGGLSEFVPYVGPTVAMVPAIGLAAAAGGDLLWRTIVAYVFVRVVEAYALTPGLTRSVVQIPPALTLFTILGVGAVFGVYGVFFAGALLVVAFVGVRELYLRDTLGEDIEGLPEKTDD